MRPVGHTCPSTSSHSKAFCVFGIWYRACFSSYSRGPEMPATSRYISVGGLVARLLAMAFPAAKKFINKPEDVVQEMLEVCVFIAVFCVAQCELLLQHARSMNPALH